jgi:CRP-like cAMP-binding protein
MTASNRIEALKELSFFQGVSEGRLAELAELCWEVEFPARTTIFEELDRAKDAYFILDGRISIGICDARGCRQISVIGKGELLGWSPLIGRTRLFDTAHTATAVKALCFQADELLEFCKKNSDFGFEFVRRVATVLAERLSATRRQLLEATGVHLPEYALESD